MDRYIVDSRVGCVAVVDTKKFEGVCLTADMPGVVAWWDGVRGANGWEVPAWAEKKAKELCALLNAAQPSVQRTNLEACDKCGRVVRVVSGMRQE